MALFSKQTFKDIKAKFPAFIKEAKETIKKRWWIMLIEFVALGILIALDLVSKHYAVAFLENKTGEVELIPGVLHLRYSQNTGAGFGMFSNGTVALTVITFIVIFGVLVYLIFAQKQSEWLRASLLLICGGGIGNLVDRIGLKYVRDFIVYAFLKDFAICNVADAFVTVGAVMLVIVLIVMLVKEGRKNQKEFEKAKAGQTPENAQDPLDAPLNLNPMLNSPNDYTFEESAQNADSDGEVAAEQQVESAAIAQDESAQNDVPQEESAQSAIERQGESEAIKEESAEAQAADSAENSPQEGTSSENISSNDDKDNG